MSKAINYPDRFQHKDAVEAYDSEEYAVDSYSSAIWEMQRSVIEQIVKNFSIEKKEPIRLLDFACGTGRVLSQIKPLVSQVDGIDISENMVAVARKKCPEAKLFVGDVLTQPELLQGEYDIISCFRFILNAEPELREKVLKRLRQVIKPDGLLITNVHGNSHSLRHLAIKWRRRHGAGNAMLNEMSPIEAQDLLKKSGFKVVRQFGFGFLPPTLYRTPVRSVAAGIDKLLSGETLWKNSLIDMLFVCHPC